MKQWRSEAVFYAGNALSTTLPGGPVLSATFVYRQQRQWGASPVVASWQLVMAGALQVAGLALLGLGGAFLLGAKDNPFSLLFTIGGFVALLLLAQGRRNPARTDRRAWRQGPRLGQLAAGKPADTGLRRWRETLSQLESVSLSRRARRGLRVVIVQLGHRRGVSGVRGLRRRRSASLPGLMVAYAAARAVGSIPLMPGGLLVVEAVLVPGLVSSGMALPDAISAMLIYRLVSWIFISAIGWVVFFFMFRTEGALDPEVPVDELAAEEMAAQETASPTDIQRTDRDGSESDQN